MHIGMLHLTRRNQLCGFIHLNWALNTRKLKCTCTRPGVGHNKYQFNSGTVMLHPAFIKTYKRLQAKKILHQNTSLPWRFPQPPWHCLVHEKYWCNTRSAMITVTTTLPVTILVIGPVRFALFFEKSHHFYHAKIVTWQPSLLEKGQMGEKSM